jgi:chromosome partitioning protein
VRTIAIANPKGGCGKTTTVVNLAASLAATGKRVLVVDLDPQAHATFALGLDPETVHRTIYHCLAKASISISALAQSTYIDGVDLAPSNMLLANAEYELVADPRRGLKLAEQLGRLDNQYDICVIDCPSSLGMLTVNALVAATDIVAPVQLHSYALETLKQLLWAVEIVRERFRDCRITRLGLLLTFVQSTPTSQEIQQQMREFFGSFVFETVIRRSISLAESLRAGQSIITYAPESTLVADYRALAQELSNPESQKQHSLVEQHYPPLSTGQPEEPELAAALTSPPRITRRGGLKRMMKVGLVFGMAILIAIAVGWMAKMMVIYRPTTDHISVTTHEDAAVSIALPANESDTEQLTYRILQEPLHGSLSGTAPQLRYTPETDFSGMDTFTFVANDGTKDSEPATASIRVVSVNDPPVAKDYDAVAQEDEPLTLDLLGQCSDVDGDALFIVSFTHGTDGFVTMNTDSTLTYSPKQDFCGFDEFTYTIDDGRGGTNTATVNVAVIAVNDTPEITSVPPSKAKAGELYTYQVEAIDQDANDTLTYSLTTKPKGMSIDSTSGLIQWTPTKAQLGTNQVAVEVADNYGALGSDTQSFTITVQPAQVHTATLTVVDGYDQKSRSRLSAQNSTHVVQSSDGQCLETDAGSYTSYEFSDMSIPAEATIRSVTVWVEHFEQEGFPSGKLEWSIGTNWPGNPVVWASWHVPVTAGRQNRRTDAWVHTGSLNTAEKVDALQLQIKNSDNLTHGKTLIDHVYAVVEWY